MDHRTVHPYSCVGVFCAVLTILSGAAWSQTLTAVRLSCDEPALVRGRAVAVYQEDPLSGWDQLDVDARFDGQGICVLSLRGSMRYRFEVAYLTDDRMVALRSDAVRVSNRALNVEIKSSGPVVPGLTVTGVEHLRITRVAIRSCGNRGQLQWESPSFDDVTPPSVITSPDMTYNVSIFADSGISPAAVGQKGPTGATVLAYWTLVRGGADWHIKPTGLYQCRFAWEQDTGQPADRTLVLEYPVATQTVHGFDRIDFRTNRRFVAMSYRYRNDQGKPIVSFPWFEDMRGLRAARLGGALSAVAWAVPMTADEPDGRVARLPWGVYVADIDGHEINQKYSELSLKMQASGDGKTWTSKVLEPSSEEQSRRMAPLLNIRVDSAVLGLDGVVLRPAPMVTVTSEDFETSVPHPWRHKAIYYLAKLQRMRRIVQLVTQRDGPVKTRVRWQSTGHTAWAVVGSQKGGQNLWILMPFGGLQSDSWYDGIWAAAHEMLHNFGYGHGEEMNRLNDRANRHFDLFRWFIEDRADYLPQ